VGLILRDPSHRIVDWSIGESGSDGKELSHASSSPSSSTPPGMRIPRRGAKVAHAHSDGSYFIYLVGGGGQTGETRAWSLWIVLQGDEPLEADIYGHYFEFGTPDLPDNSGCNFSPQTRALSGSLPPWVSPICFFNHLHHYYL
jgi:hypothetical protein